MTDEPKLTHADDISGDVMTSRRNFLLGIGAALAAPAIVKAESLMKIAVLRESMADRTAAEVLMQIMQHIKTPYTAYERTIMLGWSAQMIQSNRDVPLSVTPIAPEDVYA